MARAETASASIRSDSIKGLAQSIAKPAYRRLLTAEPALRRAVPALIIAFLLTICVGAFVQILDHRRQTIAELSTTTRSQRRCPGRTHRPGARRQERFRSPPAERARQSAAGLGALAQSPSARHQCRRRDHRRTSPRLCQQSRRRIRRIGAVGSRNDRAAARRRARRRPTAHHVRRCRGRHGNPAR